MSNFEDSDAVLVSYARTPITRAFKGSFTEVRPDDLVVHAAEAALKNVTEIPSSAYEDFIVGCAEPRGEQGDNIARRAAVLMGRDSLPGTTINRFCASSLQGVRMAFHAIQSGEGNAYLIGGVESVSRTPLESDTRHPMFLSSTIRNELLISGGGDWHDPRTIGELPDYYIGMGITAEFVARTTGTTRKAQDEWALLSQQRATAAQHAGYFDEEITPYTRADGTVISQDESIRSTTTAEGLEALSPVFSENGTVTAGNACPLNDGASALVLISGRLAKELQLNPIAKIVSTSVTALSPEVMGLGPVSASNLALSRAGLTVNDLDIVEMNEAFAAQVIPSMRQLNIRPDVLNPFGGAIALGHPYGSTGARLVGTLAHGLQRVDGQFGLATLCVGGGQGMAAVIERVS